MEKHTAGPWESREPSAHRSEIWAKDRLIATVYESCEMDVANARLIASAPELLEALTKAEEFVNNHSEHWYVNGQNLLKDIRVAIAKATDSTILTPNP